MLRKLLLIVGIMLGVLVVTLVGVRLYLTNARLTAIVQTVLRDKVPFSVQIGGIELSLTSGIVLRHIVVGPPTPAYRDNVAVIEEVRVGYSLAGLLKRQLRVTEVVLDRAGVTLEQQDGKWNVVAMGEAFASTGPMDTPPPPPQKDDAGGSLPVTLDLDRLAIIDFAAQVRSPEMSASIDKLNVEVTGAYAGETGHASVGLHLGRDVAWSHVTAAMKDKGEVALDTHLDCAIEAPSLKEASVDCTWRIDKETGAWTGFAVPGVPVTLKLKARANLLTQLATVEELSLIVGKAVAFETALKAREILGDPEIGLDTLSLRLHIAQALQLVPAHLVPAALRGFVAIALEPTTVRLSALQAKKPFDGGLSIKLSELDVISGANHISNTSVDLHVGFNRAEGIAVALKTAVARVTSPAAIVEQTSLHVATLLPWTVMEQRLDTPATIDTRVKVRHVEASGATLDDVSLDVRSKLYSLSGDKVDASVDLKLPHVEYVDPAQGTLVVPVTFHTDAEVRGKTYRARGLTLFVGEIVQLGLDAEAALKPNGVMDLDVALRLADLPLDRLAAVVPPKVRDQLQPLGLRGTVSADIKVKGPLPKDAFVGPPDALLARGTPFVLDATLAWRDIALTSGPTLVTGVGGKLSLHTQPKLERVAFETRVASVTAADETTVRDISMAITGRYAQDLGGLATELKIGEVAAPKSLAIKLNDTVFGVDVEYERGGELELKHLALRAPSVGLTFDAKGRILKPEQLGAVLEDPAWRGVQGALSAKLDVKLPGRLKPLPSPLVVSGGVGMDVELSVNDSLIKTAGALRFDRLSMSNEGLVLTNMRGKLPFQQDVRKQGGAFAGVFSSEDILRQKPRLAYYQALRSYGRDDEGLRIEKVVQGRTEIENIAVNGRIERGMLLVDHFALNALSGDVAGQLALQLSADKALRVAMGAEFSDLDVSVLSKTEPGPESQINGNMQLNLEWSERVHEVDATAFNLTRIGRKLLVKLLLALDPEEKDEKLKKQRAQLEFYRAQIKLLRASVIHNTLNLDLDYSSIADYVGWKPINSDLVRRRSILAELESALGPAMEKSVGPILGWRTKRKKGVP